MREKLLDLMKSEGMKPSQLAEALAINPAAISHILAGRNKPGFDLLQKILRRFPRINPDWLLLDSAQMFRNESAPEAKVPILKTDLFGEEHVFPQKAPVGEPDIPADDRNTTEPGDAHTANPATTQVERIVVFYTDRTFRDFLPKKN